MVNRKMFWTLCGALVVVSLTQPLAAVPYASLAARTTYVTFNQPIQLPGVTLPAGTYLFERAEPNSAPSIVRVRSGDGQHSYYQGFTNLLPRPRSLRADVVVSLGEARVGEATPVNVWWPMVGSSGHEFIYRAR